MGSSRKIAQGVVWTTIVNVVNGFYGFITVPILINYFGKSNYGLISLAMSINIYLRLLDMGFNSTNVRFFSTWIAEGKRDKIEKAFHSSLAFYGIIGIINALVLFILAFFSDSIFNVTPEQDLILKRLIYILCFTAFCSWIVSCFDQLIKATENVAWIQRCLLFSKILMIIVLIATVTLHFSIEWYYLLTCLATLSVIPIYVSKITKEIQGIRFLPKIYWPIFKEMLPYSLNIFSFSIFQFSFYNLRPVFLGIQGTIESVAEYRILNGVVGVVVMFGGAFLGVLLPSTSRLTAQHNQEAYNKVAYTGTRFISILTCFCCFGLMSVGPEVLTMYVGPHYLYLIPWFNIWLLCTLATHNQAISSLILAGTDIRAISYSSVVASILGLMVCWYTIPLWQIGGTVIGYVVYLLIQMSFYYFYYWPFKMRINSKKVFFQCFTPYVIIGACLYFVLCLFPEIQSPMFRFFIKGGGFVLGFLFFSYITLNKEDQQFILRILKKNA